MFAVIVWHLGANYWDAVMHDNMLMHIIKSHLIILTSSHMLEHMIAYTYTHAEEII